MTLNEAIMQLVMIWNNQMCPAIFKPTLNKVIETISELEEKLIETISEPEEPCAQVLGESCEIEQYVETCEECGFCDNISRQRAVAAAKEPVNPMYTWTAASVKEIEAVSSLVKSITKQVQDAIAGRIEQLPPARPEKRTEECTETHACDSISRQAAIEKILGQPPEPHYPSWYAEQIRELPPAVPKTGKWIDHRDEGYVECPFCRSATNCDGNIDELHYCFSCGAKMDG